MPIPSAPLPMWFPEGHPARSGAAVAQPGATPDGGRPPPARGGPNGVVSVTGAPWRRGVSTLVRLAALAARAGFRAGTQPRRRRPLAPEPEPW